MEPNDDQHSEVLAGIAASETDSPPPSTADVARRAKKSVSFQAVSGIISQAIRFGAGVVLARILAPEEFGILAMAEIVKGFGREFSNVGLAPSIIQRKTLDRRFLSTAFWTNLTVAGGFCLLLIAIAPLVGDFFKDAQVGSVLRISVINFFVMSSFTVWNALLMRELRFPIISTRRVLEATFSGMFCIILALLGYGVYALVYGVLASSVLSLVIIFPLAQKQVRFWPALTFAWEDLRSLISFGTFVRLKDTINYLALNVDYLLIGRLLGAGPLGFYRRAFSIMILPIEVVAHRIISPVLFPAMSRIQDDTARMVSWYEKAIVSCGLLVLPGLVGMIAVAPEFVEFVYGPKWLMAIAPLQILCLAGTVTVISTFSGAILTARKLVGRELIHQAIYFLMLSLGIFFVTKQGGDNVLARVGLVVLIARIFVYVANQQYVNRVFGHTWRRIAVILGPIVAALIMEYIAAALSRVVFLETLRFGILPTLMLSSATGGGAYGLAILMFRSNVSKDMVDRGVQNARRAVFGETQKP